MKALIRYQAEKFYRWCTHYDVEEQFLKNSLESYASAEPVILDVGCGKGRLLSFLRNRNFRALGVDLNPELVNSCLEQGLEAYSVDDLDLNLQFDVITMFHVIEHMDHERLLAFMDSYLDRLKPGGLLIIATPVMTPYFYEDFDHVKPYLPRGILMVFGEENSQVQYYSKNQLKLLNLMYKKYFWRFPNHRSIYFPNLVQRGIFVFFALLYKFSFGFIGRTDGWVGVFKKI